MNDDASREKSSSDASSEMRKKIQKTTRRWFHDTAYCFDFILIFPMVPGAGLEPAQRERRGILNPLCLPIPPSGLGKNWRRVPESNRTRRICNPLHNRFVNAPNSSGFSARHPPEPMSFKLERETRLELATPTLARSCSTN